MGTAAPSNESDSPLSATEVTNLKEIALKATDGRYGYDDLADAVLYCSKSLIRRVFGSNLQLGNYILNSWEYATGSICLESHPFNITIPVSETCNAACRFCHSYHNKLNENSWIDPLLLPKLSGLLRHAMSLGFVGYGEPLLHPKFKELVEDTRKYVGDLCGFYTITNGMLLQRHIGVLLDNNFTSLSVSLNAASAETHHTLMGLGEGAFRQIVDSIRTLKERKPGIQLSLSFVVVNQNLHEIPAFIQLAHEIGASKLYFRTLNPRESQGAEQGYHLLPPYSNPEFERYYQAAVEAIHCSHLIVEATPQAWRIPVLTGPANHETEQAESSSRHTQRMRHSVDVFHEASTKRGLPVRTLERDVRSERVDLLQNPLGRRAPFKCSYPYSNFNISNLGNLVTPCCYMQNVPGFEDMHYDGSFDFFEIWNSPAYQELRRKLFTGPLYGACLTCNK